MAWAGYSSFTPDFALIKEDLLCSTPVWKKWEHRSVPEAAREHPPARATCQQNKSFPPPWTGQLEQITARSEINLAAAICAEASPTGAAAKSRELPIVLIPAGRQTWGLQTALGQLKGRLDPPPLYPGAFVSSSPPVAVTSTRPRAGTGPRCAQALRP